MYSLLNMGVFSVASLVSYIEGIHVYLCTHSLPETNMFPEESMFGRWDNTFWGVSFRPIFRGVSVRWVAGRVYRPPIACFEILKPPDFYDLSINSKKSWHRQDVLVVPVARSSGIVLMWRCIFGRFLVVDRWRMETIWKAFAAVRICITIMFEWSCWIFSDHCL